MSTQVESGLGFPVGNSPVPGLPGRVRHAEEAPATETSPPTIPPPTPPFSSVPEPPSAEVIPLVGPTNGGALQDETTEDSTLDGSSKLHGLIRSINIKPQRHKRSDRPKKRRIRHYLRARNQLVSTAYTVRRQHLLDTRTCHAAPTGIRKALYWAVRASYVLYVVIFFFAKKAPRPYIPTPSLSARKKDALRRTEKPLLYKGKVISVFVIKGGLGKTTRALLRALALKRERPELNVLVQDCDNGTLIDRVKRTTSLCMVDAVENLPFIKTPADLARYCTLTPEGLRIMAYKRQGQSKGVRKISRLEMSSLILAEWGLVDVVICDLAPNEDTRNRGALEMTDAVELVTTPAKDSMGKALETFGWLIDNGYAHLAREAVVVVNRRMPWTNLDKIRKRFVDEFPEHTEQLRITSMNFSVRFFMGLNVLLKRLSRHNGVKLLEDNATLAEALADARIDDPESQLTHRELQKQQLASRPSIVSNTEEE